MEGNDELPQGPSKSNALANAACLKIFSNARLARVADTRNSNGPSSLAPKVEYELEDSTPNDLLLIPEHSGGMAQKETSNINSMAKEAVPLSESTTSNDSTMMAGRSLQAQSNDGAVIQQTLPVKIETTDIGGFVEGIPEKKTQIMPEPEGEDEAGLFIPEEPSSNRPNLKRSSSDAELEFKRKLQKALNGEISNKKVKREPREEELIPLTWNSDEDVPIKRETSNDFVIEINSDDDTVIVISDSEDHHSDEAETTDNQGCRVGEKVKRKTGPRARTARQAHLNAHERRQSRREARALARRPGPSEHEANPKPKQGSSKKKSRRKSGQSSQDNTILDSLFNNDVFEIGEAQVDQEPGPDFTATRTKKGLMQNLEDQMNDADKNDLHKTRVDMNQLLRKSQLFGYNNMIPWGNNQWKLNGMDTSLYHHQLIGCHFMLEREFNHNQDGPLGGILADGMGLGKTIQVIATAIANPALDEGDRMPMDPIFIDDSETQLDIIDGRGTTLIVVPSHLTTQWRDEFLKHGKPTFNKGNVVIYKNSTMKQLDGGLDPTEKKIIITSYHEVMHSCPRPDKDISELMKNKNRSKEERQEEDESSVKVKWIENNRMEGDYLHKVHWNWIVLDEAHLIKNHLSKTSLACNALLGDCRWALSGTPIMNDLDEFFAYFRFLKHEAVDDENIERFSRNLCPNQRCSRELIEMLTQTMIRRVMQDRIMGQPIVLLPRPWQHSKVIRYTATETAVYRAVERKFITLLNKHFAKGHALKNYSYMIVQMTRLRQLTAHPCLLEESMKAIFTESELRALRQTLLKIHQKSPSAGLTLHSQITFWIQDKKKEKKIMKKIEEFNALICEWCQDDLTGNEPTFISKCKHVFCLSCIQTHGEHQIASGQQEPQCPVETCGTTFDPTTNLKPYKIPTAGKKYSAKKGNKKGKDSMGYLSNTEDTHSNWVERADDGKCTWYESGKLLAVQQEIEEFLEEAPGEKMIIFAQWRLMIRLIGRYLDARKIGFVYYTGDMSTGERHRALEALEGNQKVRIMIAGLKCGGFGLNLTAASRVICCDLWWNSCVEKQAFHRVYRIGQARETHFTRIIAANTIEKRISKLQKKKEKLVNRALGDRSPTEEEIAGLFGRVTKDLDGNLRIIPEYDGKDQFDELDIDNVEAEGGTRVHNQDQRMLNPTVTNFGENSTKKEMPNKKMSKMVENETSEDEMHEDELNEDELSEDGMSE